MDQSSLERPEPETKRMVRCLAKKAKYSNRLDVVEHLREVTPAGTTGRRRQILMVIFLFLFFCLMSFMPFWQTTTPGYKSLVDSR